MKRKWFLSLPILLCAASSPAAEVVNARGNWATLSEGRTCEAASRSLSPALKDRLQARVALAFDAGGPRRGQLAVRLSRAARPDASVMMLIGSRRFLMMGKGDLAWSRGPAQEREILDAIRTSSSLQVEARSVAGGRFVDRYSLAGAPLAIDAAAACAARLANR